MYEAEINTLIPLNWEGKLKKTMFLVGPLLFGIGCTTHRMAMRMQEPADRWALAVSPQTKAPLEKPLTELPPLTFSIWSLAPAPVVFVSRSEAVNRKSWALLAETLKAPIPSKGLLDLIYPAPSPIMLPDEYSGRKLTTRFVTAEARIFR